MDVWDNDNRRFRNIVPDLICVPTQSIYEEMKGFGYDNLYLYTNPTILNLNKYSYNKTIHYENPKILFASQSTSKNYRIALNDTIQCITNTFKDFTLDIKFHPEEKDVDKIEINNKCRIMKDNPYPTIEELLINYDLVIGVDSTLQLKSYLLGIPTIFYDDLEEDLNNFIMKQKTSNNYKYKDFIECKNQEMFKLKTKELINLLTNQRDSRF